MTEQFSEAQLSAARESPSYQRAVAFEQMLDDKVEELEAKLFHSKIAGVSYRNRRGPSRQQLIEELRTADQLWLEAEPENRHDANAVKVNNGEGNQLGYLNGRVAAEYVDSHKRGHHWECYVSQVTGWEAGRHGVNIALLRWDPAHVARPEREFERYMMAMSEALHGKWRYVRLIGLRKRNEDGSNRGQLWGAIETRKALGLKQESEEGSRAARVHLVNEAGQILGTLQKKDGLEVLQAAGSGTRFVAVYRGCEEEGDDAFRPFVALLRCDGPTAAE